MITRIFLPVLFAFMTAAGSVFAQELQDLPGNLVHPFQERDDFQQLFDEIDSQRLVLMGESSHGTSEFYHWRSELSRYLIEERGFRFIAVEGDWPAFSRINAYVKDLPGAPASVEVAMESIDRWPLWMWRNMEIQDLVVWLREYNSELDPADRVGFYGVDLYAKQQAMQDVIDWLETIDTALAGRMEIQYACLSRFRAVTDYLRRVQQTGDDCSADVERVLEEVQLYAGDPEIAGSREYFNAEQNAILVVNAERHYRANLVQGPDAWNYRAGHFKETAGRLLDWYGAESQGIIWAHNTHIGDARATDMGPQGMVNIGQLSRERWGRDGIYSVGFGTYEGVVYAARQWEGARVSMRVPGAMDGSWEQMLRQTNIDRLFLLFSEDVLKNHLDRIIPHRAIGVTYNPGQEAGNYVNSLLPERYDAFVFIRETGVLDALD